MGELIRGDFLFGKYLSTNLVTLSVEMDKNKIMDRKA